MYEYITAPNLCKKVLRSVKWEFSIGDQIEENSLLCTLVIDTEEFSLLSEILNQKLFVSEKKQIYSHVVGILHKVNSVEEILTTNIVCVVRKESGSQREDEIFECSHDIEYGGICGECGKMLEEIELPKKLHCGFSGRNLKFNENIAIQIEKNKKEALLRAGKLILVLDLDHTLIHTVQGVIKGPDIVHFEIDGNFYSTKRRPHLENFLEKLQEKYEMCVYTMGTLKYAGQIVHIIDPDHCYFGDRVISKEDTPNKAIKSLNMLLPFDDSMAVILDDTTEVWPECENLIIAERFLHFQEHDELSKKHSGDNDNYLHFISNLLVKVHQKFYEEGCSDVKQILSDIKKSILKNTFLVLSGVINNEQQAEHNHFWQTAIQFGSVVTRDITKSTTHVIANSLGTKKTKQADMQKIPVLHLLWLHLSTSYWCRLPEDYFKFENIGQFEIQSILAAPLIRTHSQEEGQKRFKSHSSDSESDACITED